MLKDFYLLSFLLSEKGKAFYESDVKIKLLSKGLKTQSCIIRTGLTTKIKKTLFCWFGNKLNQIKSIPTL